MYLNKNHYSNQHSYTSNSSRTSILYLVLHKEVIIILIIDVFYHNQF